MAATLGLALSRLEVEAPTAAGVLWLVWCLASEPVPLALLLSDPKTARLDSAVVAVLQPLLGDPVAVGDAIAALRRYSLVTPAGDGLALVHRLVQAITLAQNGYQTWQATGSRPPRPWSRLRSPADPEVARGVASVRGAVAAYPDGVGPDQRRHGADCDIPGP